MKSLTKYFSKTLVVTLFVIGNFTFVSENSQAADTEEPIKIAINNWPSQQALSHIVGNLFTRLGYQVEFHSVNADLQFQIIGNGDLHLQMEVWQGTMASQFQQLVNRNRIVDLGSYTATTREEWWYPIHMETLCPGLPDWKALNDCRDILATTNTSPLGRYLTGPADWGRPDRDRIEALSLSFDVEHVSNTSDLWFELQTAVENKSPIVLMYWTPNWVEDKYEGKFIEFPKYEPACLTDASWGENPNLTHDCGAPRAGWLKKAVWSGFQNNWSCAFDLLKNIDFNNKQIAEAAAYVEIYEMSPEEAANRWLSENSLLWTKWQPTCASRLSIDKIGNFIDKVPNTQIDLDRAFAVAKARNCLACHNIESKLVGPALNDIAAKYRSDSSATIKLTNKIKTGSVGIWGNIPMPPNITVSSEETELLVHWILSLNHK